MIMDGTRLGVLTDWIIEIEIICVVYKLPDPSIIFPLAMAASVTMRAVEIHFMSR